MLHELLLGGRGSLPFVVTDSALVSLAVVGVAHAIASPNYIACLYPCLSQARTETKRLLSVMLAVPSWRWSLDLDSDEALSLTAALLKEEAVALNKAADGDITTKVRVASLFFFSPLCKLPYLD